MVQLQELGAAALVIVVAAFMIGIGSVVMTSQASSICATNGATWITFGTGNLTNTSPTLLVNPVDSTWNGCCTTINRSSGGGKAGANPGGCQTWYTSDQALNITYQGQTAMTTFGTWLPIIAVVVAAVVVIGLLVTYLGGGLGRKRM